MLFLFVLLLAVVKRVKEQKELITTEISIEITKWQKKKKRNKKEKKNLENKNCMDTLIAPENNSKSKENIIILSRIASVGYVVANSCPHKWSKVVTKRIQE